MNLRALLPFALALAAASCRDEPPKVASIHDALPNMPLPPNPGFISKSGSEEALQFVVSTPLSPARTLAYYRDVFAKAPWHLVSDQAMADSGRALYAERNGPPIWIILKASTTDSGTIVTISGAVVDKSAVAPVPPHDTTRARAKAPN